MASNYEHVKQVAMELFGDVGGAAVVGNISVETGGSFDYQQRQYGGGPGYGLFQMEDGMRRAYKEFLDKNNASDSAANQLHFAYEEVNNGNQIGPGNARRIQRAFHGDDVEEATRVFCNLFENPSQDHIE